MKRYVLILLILFAAPIIIDQTDSEFTTGTPSNINISNNQLQLNGTTGSYAAGYYLSRVFDFGSNPQIEIAWTSTSPPQTTLLVSSRSGATSTPDGSWSSYSSSYTQSSGSTVTNPDNRYFQYRIDMTSIDNTSTPTVSAVTLDYYQYGSNVTKNPTSADLDEEDSGAYRFYVDVQDTVTLNAVDARYRIGADSYNSYSAMTLESANTYYYDIPEPAGGWSTREDENISLQVRTQNSNVTNTTTLIELIDRVNNPPTLAGISNQNALEASELAFSVSASDADNDNLTYTTTHGTITKFTNTIADFAWTPTGANIGLTNVTITVSDGEAQASRTFSVNTTGVNSPPSIRDISALEVYFGQRVLKDIIVDDPNEDENLTFSTSPNLPITEISNSSASTVYVGRINFTPFDDFRGETQIFVTVTDDDQASDTKNFTLTVNYCGDNVCQENENVTACPQDCQASNTETRSYIAVEFPDRICSNSTINITTYNASSRYVCFLDGKTTDNSAAWCEAVSGVSMQFYELNGEVRIDRGSQSTNDQGRVQFTTSDPGRYRLVASADDYVGVEETFIASNCLDAISGSTEIIRTERPQLEARPMPPSIPRPERPELTQDEVSMLAIIIWYMIIPLLLASMIYVSNQYWVLYKDTDPKLLQTRIFFAEQKTKWAPKILPYWNKIKDFAWPYLEPVWKVLKQYVFIPVNEMMIKPIINKLRR